MQMQMQTNNVANLFNVGSVTSISVLYCSLSLSGPSFRVTAYSRRPLLVSVHDAVYPPVLVRLNAVSISVSKPDTGRV